jgi:hypothetical protein
MLLLLPCLLCSAYSDLAIDDLPTILCTISSKIIQIFSAASSHNANLLHTFYNHAIFIVVLAINDKHSLSVKYFPTISPFGIDGNTSTHMHLDSPPHKHPHAFGLSSRTLFSPFDINVKEETCSP